MVHNRDSSLLVYDVKDGGGGWGGGWPSFGCFQDGARDIRSQASVHSICSNDGININQRTVEESFGLHRFNSHQQPALKEAAQHMECETFFLSCSLVPSD